MSRNNRHYHYYYINKPDPQEEENTQCYLIYWIIVLLAVAIIITAIIMSQRQGYCLIEEHPILFSDTSKNEIYFVALFRQGCNSTIIPLETENKNVLIKYNTHDPTVAKSVYDNLLEHYQQNITIYCINSKTQSIPLPPPPQNNC